MIKGIFFDLGGTLYSYANMGASIVSVLGEFSQKLDLEATSENLIQSYQAANKEADIEYADQPFYLFIDYFKYAYVKFSERIDHPNILDHRDWFVDRQCTVLLNDLELKSDCHQTLEVLKKHGLYLSVVSNSDEDMLRPLIERANLENWMDHWTSSEAAKSCKPNARFFEIALKKSELTADQVLFVGDSLEQDIQGAHDIGMTTVLITEDDAPAPMHLGKKSVEPHYRINTLSELIPIVGQLG